MTSAGLDRATRDVLLRAAILAPSMHNTQPWRFRVEGTRIAVHRDPDHELPVEDPDHRATMISIGAVLFDLRVAAAHLGASARAEIRFETAEPTLAAVVTIDPDPNPSNADQGFEIGELAALYDELPHRRTNRMPYADVSIPEDVRVELGRAAAAEGAALDWAPDAHQLRWLVQLAGEADLMDSGDPERLAERRRWVGGERTDEGVPSASLGPRTEWPSFVRDLSVDKRDRIRGAEQFEPHPTLAVLSTRRDEPADWIVAGQALQHVLLTATMHELSVSLLNQPLEHPELRWLARDPTAPSGIPQAILRFGYGPKVPPTPRRPLASFLLDRTEGDG